MAEGQKTIVVTGGTSGLGQAAALSFAKLGHQLVIVGRDEARGHAIADQVEHIGGSIEFFKTDLSHKADVRLLAARIRQKHSTIDVLVNNAGGTFRKKEFTQDQIERTFALNTVTPFLLAQELLPALKKARGRIVNVVTAVPEKTVLKVAELRDPKGYSGMVVYNRAKLASMMLTLEQNDCYANDGVSAIALHPGMISGTRFARDLSRMMTSINERMAKMLKRGSTMEQSTERFVAAAFDEIPRSHFLSQGQPAEMPKQTENGSIRRDLWQLLDRMTRGAAAAKWP